MAKSYDTIVVGLGSAGVTAASTLAGAGKRVLGLEAQDRIGGRVKTVLFGDGVVEEGGEWIQGTDNSRVYETAVKHNIPTIPQEVDFQVYKSDGTVQDSGVVNELIKFCVDSLNNSLVKPEAFGTFITIKLEDYLKDKYPDFLKDEEFVVQFLQLIAIIINNYESYGDWNQLSTRSGFKEIGGHQHESWHKYGYRTFFELLLKTYNNGPGLPTLDIKLNKEVTSIKWPQDSAGKVEVVCKDGDAYTADHVIVTVSLGVLKERHSTLFLPSLPLTKINVIENISMAVLDKIIMNFNEEWLPSGTFFGFLWRGEDLKNISKEDVWTTKTFLFSRSMGLRTAITLFASGETAKQIETLPEEIVKTKVIELLRRFFGKTVTVPEPIGMVRSSWYTNPFTRGSVSCDNTFVAENRNARTVLGEPLLDDVGVPRVLFAGEATDVTHYGTVHGASDSGYREAKKLI